MLPEQDSPMTSFPQMSCITHPPALPPIQSQTIPLPQTWPDTSFDLAWGQQAPAGSPATKQPASSRPRDTSIRPATSDPHYVYVSSTSELDLVWDNLNIPYTAYFPQREDPNYGATAEYPSIVHWDEPIRITT